MNDLQRDLADFIRQHLPVGRSEQNGHQSMDDHQRQLTHDVFIQALATSILEAFEVRRKDLP